MCTADTGHVYSGSAHLNHSEEVGGLFCQVKSLQFCFLRFPRTVKVSSLGLEKLREGGSPLLFVNRGKT